MILNHKRLNFTDRLLLHLFIMCSKCLSSGFHSQESINEGTLVQKVLSRNYNLANNLVDESWLSVMKNPANGFVDDNRIDIHVSNDIPKPFKGYTKRMIRKIDRLTGIKIKNTKMEEKADIIVDDVEDYDKLGIGDANGVAYLDLKNMKMRATWLKEWNHCNYNNPKGKCKVWNYTKRLIIHEVLHTLGLSHPFGNGNTEGYNNTDTAMSYNFVDYGVKNPLRPADVMALQAIWG